MIRTRPKKVLLVASHTFPDQLLAGNDNVHHVSAMMAIFPSIHELKPDVILFDHAHMAGNFDRVLRRLQTNPFYKHIKICCYKHQESITADATLKALGVHHMIYHTDVQKQTKSSAAFNAITNLVNASLIKLIAGVSH
ncbi:hypothetical protein [Mucilaginibacter phyllosphaerae]|uniref:Uncharacterized protein n=1 Tax=Mucilaginibacter phyllosphaerae TaxID=1812349 RepID=A0A4Y8ABB3_9SPHI|nr:hypothetical protein [Mucilaginibacter phyllosphaerae]MBB3969749.1 hypothetical protein [Mucilaginibacter phyllosphaerae]TEW65131.1 hypothetical protein E2R65_14540 [Mucilaginibacter phyllosphaerae]GGH17776.1 hypothetical protein GCM10007352_28100 [Mucilaginibacter phyllosphaerae]